MARAPKLQEVEDTPESDRLGDFPHPRATTTLFGHTEAEELLATGLASGRLPHGLIVTGPSGIGKATLAYRFARAALHHGSARNESPATLAVPEACSAAYQVAAGSHPGLLVLRRPYDHKAKRFLTSIPIDEVRRLRTFLAHKAGGEHRVVIVDTADDLNVNAANAILKSLEEPPARTTFLLLSSEPGRLIRTIRSRCRLVDLAPLSRADLDQAARAAYRAAGREPPAPSEWERLLPLAHGSVRRLVGLEAGGGIEMAQVIDRLLGALPRLDVAPLHDLAESLAPVAAEERFELFFELLSDRLRDLVRAAAGRPAASEADMQLAGRLGMAGALATWAGLWETIAREKADAMALNLDRKALVIETFRRIATAARS
ncbi:MAG: DNA polymerase III subunit delta' [Hyphomicrobiaceae bacterium]|nr:DNA polymerase III subunit delta' [Hyphomicrobiaceae bacterium]